EVLPEEAGKIVTLTESTADKTQKLLLLGDVEAAWNALLKK
ncbi:MAG: hypothetical protein ACI849_001769, partial [Patiriisocius sp.]